MLLQATLALSLVVSSLKSVCCDFSIFFAVTVLKTGLQDAVKHGGIIEGRGSVGDTRFLFQLSSDEPTRLRNKFRMSQVSREDYLRSS